MNARPPSRLPSRSLVSLAIAALVFGVRYDAYAYGNHRDKGGDGVLVSHAQGLPDLARGKQSAAAGRLDDAEADLKPLAEQGYVEAQIALARLYAQIGTPERVSQAIGWLRTASANSPLDTEVPLGRLLIRQNDDASIAEGEALLATAWDEHHDRDALVGLIRIYSDYPQRDTGHRVATLVARAEQIGAPDMQGAVIGWYRGTRHDQGHAEKLLTLCGRWVNQVPECYVDLVRAERAANNPGRLQALVTAASDKYDDGLVDAHTLVGIARVLVAPLDVGDDDDDDSDAPMPAVRISDVREDEGELSETAVQAQAAAKPNRSCTRVDLTSASGAANANGNVGDTLPAGPPAQPELANSLLSKLLDGPADAPVLAAGVVTRYPYLLPNAEIEARLKHGVEQGIPEATLYLGELYLAGVRAPRDPAQALRYLQQAATQPETALKGHYELGRLFAYGYLDESRPLLAAQYLMWSARRGYAAADGALARLFVSGKGLCPNLANAYVFARLGAREGSASIALLEQQIAARLPADEVAQADSLYAGELGARPSAYRIPQTMLAEAAAIAAEHGVQIAAVDNVETGAETKTATDEGAAPASDPVVVPAATSAAADAMPAAVPGAAAPTVTAGDDMQVPTPAMVAPDEVQAVAVPEPSVASTPAMDASASAAPAASMVAVPATKATIISREASTASDALPLQLSGHLASVSTSGTTDVSPTSPAAVVHLSHRPSTDPALRALFDDAPPPLDPVKSATPATPDAHSIEYIVPVQVPSAAPATDLQSRPGDRS